MNLTTLVNLLVISGLFAMMLSMGFKVTTAELAASIRIPRLVVAGVVANFVLVPAVTMSLLYLFRSDPLVSIGFLIMAVCPGAPVGPPFAAVAKGEIPYATGQMVVLAGASALLAPALLRVLLPPLMPESVIRIDYLGIVRTLLVSQLLPLVIGLSLHYKAPKFAEQIAKPVGVLANFLLLGVVLLVLIRESDLHAAIRLRGWIGMFLLLAASLVVGWLCGGPGRGTRRALAVTTGPRNAGVALVIVTANFAETAAVTAVIAYALVSIFATLGCAFLLAIVPDNDGGIMHPRDSGPKAV